MILLYLGLSLLSLPLCSAGNCSEAVQEVCQEVITENNDQLLGAMEEMVANRSRSDEQLKDDLILHFSDQFSDVKEYLGVTMMNHFDQLSQKVADPLLGE